MLHLDLVALLASCAPLVHPIAATAIVETESGGNPHAIGVVGDALVRQPRTAAEALATMQALDAGGRRYSVGLAQINAANFARLGLTAQTALEPCRNLAAMQAVLLDCHTRAGHQLAPQQRLRRTLSCYYSGRFDTGFRHGYVSRVVRAAQQSHPALK